MSEKLKPCPFCGGQAVLHKAERESFLMAKTIFLSQISCASCGVNTGVFKEEDNAIKAWNRRTEQ
jgi:Lar family restriction alleviation protein